MSSWEFIEAVNDLQKSIVGEKTLILQFASRYLGRERVLFLVVSSLLGSLLKRLLSPLVGL